MLKTKAAIMTFLFAVSLVGTIEPAEAGFWRNTRTRFQRSVREGRTSVRFNYTPPKSIVSGSCDPQGRAYGSISPKLRTPVGTVGATVSRRFSSARCWKR